MEYSIIAKNVSHEISEVTFANTKISFDSSKDRNTNLAGPSEILCTAFAACCLKNVERFSELLKFNYEYAEIEVKAIREEKPPRIATIQYLLLIKTSESDHALEHLHKNIKQFGTIYNTLNASCTIEGSIKRLS